jgi:hypothetical protein
VTNQEVETNEFILFDRNGDCEITEEEIQEYENSTRSGSDTY